MLLSFTILFIFLLLKLIPCYSDKGEMYSNSASFLFFVPYPKLVKLLLDVVLDVGKKFSFSKEKLQEKRHSNMAFSFLPCGHLFPKNIASSLLTNSDLPRFAL